MSHVGLDGDMPAFPQHPDGCETAGLTIREYTAIRIAAAERPPVNGTRDQMDNWAIRIWAATDALLRNA